MEKRTLGSSGVELPVLGFGCGPNAQLMVSDDRAAQIDVVGHAMREGITYFDTAAGYGDGRSETNLGAVLKELDAHPTLSTKAVLEEPDLVDVKGSVLRCFDASLERLQVDRVDALMLHNRVAHSREYKTAGSGCTLSLDDMFGPGGVSEAFEEIIASGRVTTVGFTAFGGEPAAIEKMITSKLFGAINASYNMVNPSAGVDVPSGYSDANYERVIDQAREAGMGVMVIRVLSSGSLVRPYEPGSREDRLVRFAKEHGLDVVDLAIRYALSKPGVTSAIMGITEISHVDDAVRAANAGSIGDDVIAEINQLILG